MSKKHPQTGLVTQPEAFHLPCTGVDAHAHLDLRHFCDDLPTVLARAKAAGVAHIGNVFLRVSAWEKGQHLFADIPEVFFLLGIHPTDAMECTPKVLDDITAAFTTDKRLRALGEIGLDFYWKDCPPDIQRVAFISQLRLARILSLPVVIHSRDAYADTVAILDAEGFRDYPLLWHCFGGTVAQAEELVDAGWHISIPGPVTFPANQALRDAVREIPVDRLLVETDCPYLSPVPWRGKRNEPAYTAYTIACMAEAKGMDAAELWTICGNNACRFFGL